MDISLLSYFGFDFLMRWMHFLAGVAWIGLLWYFNFVQGSWFKETDNQTKTAAFKQLVPRALWWFRYGALFTFLSGVTLLLSKGHMTGWGIYETSWGVHIQTGALLGTLMFLNVWLVIWPNQKILIAQAKGETITKDPVAAGAKATLASRTNTMFSVPMLFMMGAASHLPVSVGEGTVPRAMGVIGLVVLALEVNALKGKLGPLTTVRGVITCGFVLTAVLYGLIELIC